MRDQDTGKATAGKVGKAAAGAQRAPGDFGVASGIGAAAMVGGALATPDLAVSALLVCSGFSVWRHATGEERVEAGKELLAACAGVVSNGAAVSGGVATGAGAVTGSVAQGVAGGGLGILTGLVTAIQKAVDAHKAHKQEKALRQADFPTKDFRHLRRTSRNWSGSSTRTTGCS